MKSTRILLAGTLLLLLAGCSLFAPDEKALQAPSAPEVDPGEANFERYMALGNSLSAGYQSGALYASAQAFSFTNLLAQAMQTDFEQPLISDPGIFNFNPLLPVGHLQIVFDQGEAGLAPIPWTAGAPHVINSPEGVPYHNLSIPGALLADLVLATDAASSMSGTNIYCDYILRNAAIDWTEYGAAEPDLTAFEQLLLAQPTFVTIWAGSNEFLGAAKEGLGAPLVDLGMFRNLLEDVVLTTLAALLPETDVVLANIPPVTVAPYFTTVPWFVVNPLTEEPVDGDPETAGIQPVGLLSEDALGQLVSGDLVLLSILSYDADENGKPDVEEGMGIPEAVLLGFLIAQDVQNPEEALPVVFPHAAELLPGSLTLIASEVENLQVEVDVFNQHIQSYADDHEIPVVDVYNLFLELVARDAQGEYVGTEYNGSVYTPEFVTGGIFSLDGIHPTKIGNAIVAREFIEVINEAYGSNLEPPSLPYVVEDYAPEGIIAFVPPRLPAP